MPVFVGTHRSLAASPKTVVRASGQGLRTTVQTLTGNTAQRGGTFRFPKRFQVGVRRISVRLQLFYQKGASTKTNPVVDTLFPSPMRFQFGAAAAYVNAIAGLPARSALTFGGVDHYEYPGAVAYAAANSGKLAAGDPTYWYVDSDWVDLGALSNLIDFHSTVEYATGFSPTAAFTGTIAGTTLTVSSLTSGTIQVGQVISGAGVTTTNYTNVVAQLSGTAGGAGTYQLSDAYTISTAQGFAVLASLPWNKAATNALPRTPGNIGLTSSAASHIDAGFALTSGVGASPSQPITLATSAPGGSQAGFTPCLIRYETTAGAVKTMWINGDSHGEGLSEGSPADSYLGVPYADFMGDAICNRGMFDAAAWDAGFDYVNTSRGSEWMGNWVTANRVGSKAVIADQVFERYLIAHGFNDFNKASVATWAANTAFPAGTAMRNPGGTNGNNVYVALNAGTSAASGTGPGGTAAQPIDGSIAWQYVEPYSTTQQLAAAAVLGDMMVGCAQARATFPTIATTISLPLPSPTSTKVTATSAAASSTSAGATITLGVPNASLYAMGQQVTVAGSTTAGYNSPVATGTVLNLSPITAVDPANNLISYLAPAAPGALTGAGTLTIDDNYSTLTHQVADTGQGSGPTNTRGLYFAYCATRRDLLPGLVNTIDPSAFIENDHANLDGKTIADGTSAFPVMYGSHLNGHGAFLAKQCAPAALLNARG